jgi:hypothetical protein
VQAATLPPVLAEVQYHMRLKGFMRPRKCGHLLLSYMQILLH